MLSPLAYHFGVTIDELLGYNESIVHQEIEDALCKYRELSTPKTWEQAHNLIVEAHEKYPNDYGIMHRYMWDIVGGSADNNADVLLSHKDEFMEICKKIIEGCSDNGIRLEAYTMMGKLLWAENKHEEALRLYSENLPVWYSTAGQKSEQLFSKNTPEFLYWVRKNMNELIFMAGDKLSKSIFFDSSVAYDEKVKRIELYADRMMSVYDETGEEFFLIFAQAIIGRLASDLKHYGGTQSDIERINDKVQKYF